MALFKASSYTRASKDERDSDTIQNQKNLIRQYLDGQNDIELVSEREDEGFSGVDFDRPDFEKMMTDIKSGLINCVIVKDLSRLGRNYIEVGEYMEKIFPFLKVRLIAVNDHYDSFQPRTDADDYVIPFKNLVNESYLRDTSIKIRSNLEVSRKNGKFVGAFATYGYIRSENNKHRLEIDPYAAQIVRYIFKQAVAGHSCQTISDNLNDNGEPSPAEYKKRNGSNHKSNLQTKAMAEWSSNAVRRILLNPVYIGTLIQGKRSTPNYKIKKAKAVPECDWAVVENTHEAIIDTEDFETVKHMLSHDFRRPADSDKVRPLSGYLYCADCGNNLVRKTVGKYKYYVCSTNKAGNGCSQHTISETALENAVFMAIRFQIYTVLDIGRCIAFLRSLSKERNGTERLAAQLTERENEIKKIENYKRSLYEDLKDNTINNEDYIMFNKDYTKRLDVLNAGLNALKSELELINNESEMPLWMTSFIENRNVDELSRTLVVQLIDKITVYEDKRIEVIFRFADKQKQMQNILEDIEIIRKGETTNGTEKQKAKYSA